MLLAYCRMILYMQLLDYKMLLTVMQYLLRLANHTYIEAY